MTAPATNNSARIDRRTTTTSFGSHAGIRNRPPSGFGDDAPVEGFELVDTGDGRRLERLGAHLVDRPAPAARPARRAPREWADADLRFDRDRGWSGDGLAQARQGWTVRIHDLSLELHPTDAGQVGFFPEHDITLPWLLERIAERDNPTVLNLFGYTGLATLALARAGASIAHVDAARSAVSWARRNAARNGLADRPIRWLVDDARAFVARDIRRNRRFHGVVLDPPTYGHGSSGKAWRLDDDLEPLLEDIRRLLEPDGFILLTAHTESIDPGALGAYLGPGAEVGELALDATSGATLRLGAFARIDGRA
jgi:23S rRNA (cytosine1962-C5)-methyltransferase